MVCKNLDMNLKLYYTPTEVLCPTLTDTSLGLMNNAFIDYDQMEQL